MNYAKDEPQTSILNNFFLMFILPCVLNMFQSSVPQLCQYLQFSLYLGVEMVQLLVDS